MDELYNFEHSKEREDALKGLFQGAGNTLTSRIVTAGLALPFVNNRFTAHKIVMLPQSKKMRVAFDNAYAGARALHELDTRTLLN